MNHKTVYSWYNTYNLHRLDIYILGSTCYLFWDLVKMILVKQILLKLTYYRDLISINFVCTVPLYTGYLDILYRASSFPPNFWLISSSMQEMWLINDYSSYNKQEKSHHIAFGGNLSTCLAIFYHNMTQNVYM